MNTRKLINSCAFDLPVCFPVPMTGLELLSDLLPFYISLSCYITSALPFYNSSKFYFVIRGVLFIFIFTLSILEPGVSIMALTFECVSALSTVGSSLNLTPHLCDASKLLVSLLMFIGRVGLITLMLGIVKQKKNTKYRYPSDNIIIN